MVLPLACPAFCLLSLLTTNNTNIHAPGGIQTRNPSKRSAADPLLRADGHWNRPPNIIRVIKSKRVGRVGHVALWEKNRNAYRILDGNPEGKRLPWRRIFEKNRMGMYLIHLA
jgi:hypothetical protein